MGKRQLDHNGLTAKQGLFCHEFVKDYNAQAAYIRSGHKVAKDGTNRHVYRYMKNPALIAYIKKLHEKQLEKADISAQRITDELAKMAFSNIKNYIQEGNELTDIKELDDDVAAAIESVKITRTMDKFKNETVNVAFKLHGKKDALELLAKHIGYFEKDNKQKPVLGNIIIEPSGPVPPPITDESSIELKKDGKYSDGK